MVLWFRGERSSSNETEVERELLGLQEVDEDKTKDQLQLLHNTYS